MLATTIQNLIDNSRNIVVDPSNTNNKATIISPTLLDRRIRRKGVLLITHEIYISR